MTPNEITFKTRLCAITGMPHNSTDAELLAHCKQLMKDAETSNVVSEHDRKVKSMMEDMNCSRETAEFAIAEQARYDANPPPRF